MSLVSTFLAITFIIRLHCGQHISIFNHIYRRYGEEGRGLFRNLESKSLKLRKQSVENELRRIRNVQSINISTMSLVSTFLAITFIIRLHCGQHIGNFIEWMANNGYFPVELNEINF